MGLLTGVEGVTPRGTPGEGEAPLLFAAEHLGVKYAVGGKREDYQSRAYNFLFKKRRPSAFFWALKDIHLEGRPGDIIGVIGRNGAGKTTLCRVISGLIRPDEGQIRVHGAVSALFSLGTGFNPELSGRENIYLNGMMLGFSKKDLDAMVEAIIAFSELEAFIEQPLKHYSSGMKARLGFSIAAMFEPDILILDEALSTGDLHFSLKAAKKMKAIINRAKMVIAVTHQLEFVMEHCNRAVWLDKGRIAAEGPPEKVVPLYLEAFRPLPETNIVPMTISPTRFSIKNNLVVRTRNLGVRFSLHRQKKKGQSPDGQGLPPLPAAAPRDFWALKDVNLNVREGDILGVIGMNAAGKSTLCRALSGILKPDAGEVFVEGRITALLSLGTGFHLELSGRDNIFLNGMFQGFTKRKMAGLVEEIVAFSELGDAVDQPVKHYSSGMMARLGFSIIASLQPDVFIIDEALNAGDMGFYLKSTARIQELMRRAKATIVVTHNTAFVESICTRAVWLDAGRIVFQGEAGETVAAYCRAMGSD